jgi:NADH-quinone oxidoreductase subunit L
LIFGGTVGKSAQVPLHVWLPDAMEGPTPVSALIHAATMVSAGVYLAARMWPLTLAAASLAPGIVLWIGAITAAYGAIIGAFQDDIKRVLAFSTISQLGYMITALGLGAAATDPTLQIGAYVAGVFHLITHAFFKALLFLASGSVIHGMEHGHHHAHAHGHGEHHEEKPFDPNDMKNMGGLRTRMPRTFLTFLAGGLALSGFPLITAGFWSKDEILAMASEINPAVFWVLVVSAGLTAFYTARQIAMTFLGKPRTSAAEHAPESVPSMTVPLIILAVFAVTLGWAGIPEDLPLLGGVIPNWVHHFVGATIEEHVNVHGEHAAVGQLASLALSEGAGHEFNVLPLAIGLSFALGGLVLGGLVYWYWRPLTRADELDPLERGMRKVWLGWLYEFFRRRMMLDEVYHVLFVRSSIWIADMFDAFDYGQGGEHGFVDGLVNLAGLAGRGLSVVADWLDANAVDWLVNLAGRVGRAISDVTGRLDVNVVDWLVNLAGRAGQLASIVLDLIDLRFVDGAVDGIGVVTRILGRGIRRIQTGRVQDYLLLASLVLLLLLVVFLFLPSHLLQPVSLGLLFLAVILVIYFMVQPRKSDSDKESVL